MKNKPKKIVKKVLWFLEDGTYEDQFGVEHECAFVKQQTVTTRQKVERKEGGYGQTTRKSYYEDAIGRTFTHFNDGISYKVTDNYREIGKGRYWIKADDGYNGPYLRKDTMEKVEPLDKNDEKGYRFYEVEQTAMF